MLHPLIRRASGGALAAPAAPSGGSPAGAGPDTFRDALHSSGPAADRTGEISTDGGAGWRLQVEVLAPARMKRFRP